MKNCTYLSFVFKILVFLEIICCPSVAQDLFIQHTIDTNFLGACYVCIYDLDGDGDLDIIAGSETTPYTTSKGIAWWRNDGGNPIGWTKFVVDSTFIHVMSVDAAYIDPDNNVDIVASSWQLNQVAWWKNSGNPELGWTKNIVKSGYVNAHDAQCADIDQDGDTDIITAASLSGSIDICYNDNNIQPSWSCVQVDLGFSGAKSVRIIDLDLDTDFDIVGTADGVNDIAWWENTGTNSQVWSKTTIDDNFAGSCFADVIDMNEDFKLDIIATAWSSNQLAYWICNDLSTNSWTKYIVSSSLQLPARTFGCDFDMDYDVDIVAVGKVPGKLSVFINDDFNWTELVLQSDFLGAAALAAEDLDQDGDKDIIAGAGVTGDLFWWENTTIPGTGEDEVNLRPLEFHLRQNYPNPFHRETIISYQISECSFVTIKVYDASGNEIKTLVNEEKTVGSYDVEFNATALPGGVYFYRIQTEKFAEVKKMIIIK
jgi:hypothetical protein